MLEFRYNHHQSRIFMAAVDAALDQVAVEGTQTTAAAQAVRRAAGFACQRPSDESTGWGSNKMSNAGELLAVPCMQRGCSKWVLGCNRLRRGVERGEGNVGYEGLLRGGGALKGRTFQRGSVSGKS